MLKGLLEDLKRRSLEGYQVDATVFGDPLAERVSWSPAKRGGASFKTHVMESPHPDLMMFRPSMGARVFMGFAMLMGMGVPLVFIVVGLLMTADALFKVFFLVIPIVVGSVFFLVGRQLMGGLEKPRVFDRRRRLFIIGHEKGTEIEKWDLNTVKALQILRERCSSDNGSYDSYELNLVFADGERANVVDHGNLKDLQADTAALSRFLSVPVWDGTKAVR